MATMTTVVAPPAAASPEPSTTWNAVFLLHDTITKPPLSVTCVRQPARPLLRVVWLEMPSLHH